ncbi:hypothetical protein LTR85_007023 [Meristemomyces frigidus]|nr:hypothetical protein LTR85_007023 [Meristemomyces frigidus]
MAPKSPWNKKATNVTNTTEHAMSPALNCGEVQAEEVGVLQAIYMEDYEEVETKSAWSKTTDRSFKLRVRSFTDQESFIVILVKFTATYPKTSPLLEVSSVEGYHERTQKQIRNIVQNRPKQLLGEAMIHTIAEEIREALEDAVNARQQGTLPSLEEERASAEEVASVLAKEAEETEVRRQREAQEEEDRVLKQMVNEELTRREKRKSTKSAPTFATQPSVGSEDFVAFDQPATLHVGNERLEFNTVTIISSLAQRTDEELFLAKPQVVDTASSTLVAIKKLTSTKSRDEIMEIESMLENIRKLHHANVLALLAYRIERVDSTISQIILCSDYADRGTLQDMLDLVDHLHVNKARRFAVELLEALDYLHHNGIAHGNLSSSSVFLNSTPSLSPKLGQLGQWMLQVRTTSIPSKWRAPEGVEASASLRRKSDIWEFGVIAVQMFMGKQAISNYQSPHTLLSRADLTDAFDDFLRKMFAADPKKRPSAFDLLPAEFLRTDAPVFEHPMTAVRKQRHTSSAGITSPTSRRSRHNSSNVLEPMSRYASDFTELGRLGKGGFGEVVKARNKLDGGVYAVKKVKQAPQLLDQVLSEVMLLNKLNHAYIVRYFSTWVETDVSGAISESATTTTETTEEALEETTEDFSSEGPRMDFGFQSTGGLDFVSSSGYPQIEFGDDDADEDASSDEEAGEGENDKGTTDGESTIPSRAVSQVAELGLRQSRSDSRRLPSILYIQMEYCERQTLRDLIRKTMSVDDAWRYARQITEGLSHIHEHGIIHRDLKPDNVFIDMAGNPKIGDFGLATTSQYHFVERAATMSGQSGGDMTRSVGTKLYVAPELRTAAGGSYNDKVDMYSLGIMFYEMCEEFSTTMERIRALQQIREKNYVLPSAYHANNEMAAQGRLIDCLISHKSSERPSSTELLRSDILPVKVEDEAIRQALAGLSDSRSPYHQKMMSALFAHDSSSSDRVKALAWEAKGPAVTDDASRLRLRTIARQTMESVFRRHGAEEARRPTIFPRSNHYTSPNVVQLLDASGSLLQLPFDLTLPHARQLAKHAPDIKKTFVFGNAYRDAFTGGPPRMNDEVDFDITLTGRDDDSTFDEAEVLKVMDEIVCEIPAFAASTNVCFHLNHTSILDVILEHCRVPTARQPVVKETISKLGYHQWTWPKVRTGESSNPAINVLPSADTATELRKIGLPDTTLDDLQQYDFRDTPERAFSRLRMLLEAAPSWVRTRLDHAIRALGDIVHLTAQLSLQRKLFVAPLGAVNAKFYEGGMLFQCVLERKSNRTVIAAGGRYDSLVRAHRTINSSAGCSGVVGVAIGLDPILTHMAKSLATRSKTSYLRDAHQLENPPKRCEVLVEGTGTEGGLAAAIKLLATLWANGISAELATDSRVSSDNHSHGFIVTVRHEASSTVRVRNTVSDAEETDVPAASLVSHLQQELRDRENSKPRQPAFVRQASHHDADRKSNVQVLMSQHRSKKSNKYHIVEAAQQRWAEKLDEMKDASILAVETRDDVLESIRDTRLGDAESWRKAVQGAQLNERQYLQQVQDILASWRKKWEEGDGEREACVFNFRTGHCIYYDLGS